VQLRYHKSVFAMGLFSKIKKAVKQAASTVGDAIKNAPKTILNKAKEAIQEAKDGVKKIAEGVKEMATGAWSVVKGVGKLMGGLFKGVFTGNWQALKDGFQDVTGGMAGFFMGFIKAALGIVGVAEAVVLFLGSPIPYFDKIAKFFFFDLIRSILSLSHLIVSGLIWEFLDNLAHGRAWLDINCIYGNYCGNYLKGQYQEGFTQVIEHGLDYQKEDEFTFPPIDQLDFICYLHDRETMRNEKKDFHMKGNPFSDLALGCRLEIWKELTEQTTDEQLRTYRKIQVLISGGNMRNGVDPLSAGISFIFGLLGQYGSGKRQLDCQRFQENKDYITTQFDCDIARWKEEKMSEKGFPPPETLKSWFCDLFLLPYEKFKKECHAFQLH
jgi:hypothetical protein